VTQQTPKQKRPVKVTIRTVAEIAGGVSIATVSNVINNTGKFSPAAKNRVNAAIQSANWEPNVNARGLAMSSGAY